MWHHSRRRSARALALPYPGSLRTTILLASLCGAVLACSPPPPPQSLPDASAAVGPPRTSSGPSTRCRRLRGTIAVF